MSALRYRFGNRITGVYPRPSIPGELPDAATVATIANVTPANPGEINVEVQFDAASVDPATVNPPVELHAIAYAPGHGIPSDEELAIADDQPKASIATTHGQTSHSVTIAGVPMGPLTIVTVHGFAPTVPAPASDPSVAPTSPVAAASAAPDPATPAPASTPATS